MPKNQSTTTISLSKPSSLGRQSLGIFDPTPLGPRARLQKAPLSPEMQVLKPKRPLTAYNLFFKNERQRLLDTLPAGRTTKSKTAHGKIGFQEMATVIGQRWQNADQDTRAYFYGLANQEKLRYHRAMDEYRARLRQQQQHNNNNNNNNDESNCLDDGNNNNNLTDFEHLATTGIPALAEQLGKEMTEYVIQMLR